MELDTGRLDSAELAALREDTDARVTWLDLEAGLAVLVPAAPWRRMWAEYRRRVSDAPD